MPVIDVHVTEDGFQVSGEFARELGLTHGEDARIEIRRALDAKGIRERALRFAWRRFGDAVGVDSPEWDGEYWVVPLKVRGQPKGLGSLFVSPEGEVLADKSTRKEDLLEKLGASRSTPSAA